jgi:hypothetical protein
MSCTIVVQVVQKSFCDSKSIEYSFHKLEKKVKINKSR